MLIKIADSVINWSLKTIRTLKYVLISGNIICVDKKCLLLTAYI